MARKCFLEQYINSLKFTKYTSLRRGKSSCTFNSCGETDTSAIVREYAMNGNVWLRDYMLAHEKMISAGNQATLVSPCRKSIQYVEIDVKCYISLCTFSWLHRKNEGFFKILRLAFHLYQRSWSDQNLQCWRVFIRGFC